VLRVLRSMTMLEASAACGGLAAALGMSLSTAVLLVRGAQVILACFCSWQGGSRGGTRVGICSIAVEVLCGRNLQGVMAPSSRWQGSWGSDLGKVVLVRDWRFGRPARMWCVRHGLRCRRQCGPYGSWRSSVEPALRICRC
jgi:hypothetical protein